MTAAQKLFALSIVISALAGRIVSQVPTSANAEDAYENHNQIDYGPLKVSAVKGMAVDNYGAPVPHTRILLFTNNEHELVSKTETNDDGFFDILKIADGKYRLVAKGYGFCVANVPLTIKARSGAKRLVLHMKLGAVDSCSYGTLK